MKFENYDLKDVGKISEFRGWIQRSRKLGNIIFVDLRHHGTILQFLFKKEQVIKNPFKVEDLLWIKGEIVKRKSENKNLKTGKIEVIVKEFKILATSKFTQLPISLSEQNNSFEETRMRYRYLDLRNPKNINLLLARSKLYKVISDFFHSRDFIEIETPLLTRRTIGGAEELTVLTRHHPGKEYVLAQSPQIYKQLLIYSGIDAYFQIVKCFRDEDSRSDRQLEFTQLDLEIAYSQPENIYLLIENLLKDVFKVLLKKKLITPFPILTYQQALNNYGTDKPDLRIKNRIFDLTNILKNSEKILSEKNSDNLNFKGLFFDQDLTKSRFKKILNNFKNSNSNFKLFLLKCQKGQFIEKSGLTLSKTIEKNLIKLAKSETFSLFLTSIKSGDDLETFANLRNYLGKEFKLLNNNEFSFCWITDWPLFLLKDQKLHAAHNPFSQFMNYSNQDFLNLKNNDQKELTKILSKSYDLVLNGVEIGGGALRITDPNVQKKVFQILQMSEKEIKNNFSWLLEAQEYAIPQHGGIALGIDRLLALLFDQNSIREVIAFPKSSHGTDELTGAPTDIFK